MAAPEKPGIKSRASPALDLSDQAIDRAGSRMPYQFCFHGTASAERRQRRG